MPRWSTNYKTTSHLSNAMKKESTFSAHSDAHSLFDLAHNQPNWKTENNNNNAVVSWKQKGEKMNVLSFIVQHKSGVYIYFQKTNTEMPKRTHKHTELVIFYNIRDIRYIQNEMLLYCNYFYFILLFVWVFVRQMSVNRNNIARLHWMWKTHILDTTILMKIRKSPVQLWPAFFTQCKREENRSPSLFRLHFTCIVLLFHWNFPLCRVDFCAISSPCLIFKMPNTYTKNYLGMKMEAELEFNVHVKKVSIPKFILHIVRSTKPDTQAHESNNNT